VIIIRAGTSTTCKRRIASAITDFLRTYFNPFTFAVTHAIRHHVDKAIRLGVASSTVYAFAVKISIFGTGNFSDTCLPNNSATSPLSNEGIACFSNDGVMTSTYFSADNWVDNLAIAGTTTNNTLPFTTLAVTSFFVVFNNILVAILATLGVFGFEYLHTWATTNGFLEDKTLFTIALATLQSVSGSPSFP
jgi:hypothetical protein